MALRPRESPKWISSLYASQALAERLRSEGDCETDIVADPAPESVITSLAGFAGPRRPHPPGDRTGMPAARRYPPMVSRRMCTAASMRLRDHPSRPSAMTCCFFSSLKTLLTLTEGIPPSGLMSWFSSFVGRFSGDYRWPVLGDCRWWPASAMTVRILGNRGPRPASKRAPAWRSDTLAGSTRLP